VYQRLDPVVVRDVDHVLPVECFFDESPGPVDVRSVEPGPCTPAHERVFRREVVGCRHQDEPPRSDSTHSTTEGRTPNESGRVSRLIGTLSTSREHCWK
jgi:hypothetical protein